MLSGCIFLAFPHSSALSEQEKAKDERQSLVTEYSRSPASYHPAPEKAGAAPTLCTHFAPSAQSVLLPLSILSLTLGPQSDLKFTALSLCITKTSISASCQILPCPSNLSRSLLSPQSNQSTASLIRSTNPRHHMRRTKQTAPRSRKLLTAFASTHAMPSRPSKFAHCIASHHTTAFLSFSSVSPLEFEFEAPR